MQRRLQIGRPARGSYFHPAHTPQIQGTAMSALPEESTGRSPRPMRSEVSFLGGFSESKNKKNTFFKKQSGEVAENKGKDYIASRKQTEKQSGEVVENTRLWKKQTEKQTGNDLETESLLSQ